MTSKFLKPAEGRSVYQMDGRPWPEAGMDAEDSLFVRRRLQDGDLIPAERDTEATETPVEQEVPAAAAETKETPQGRKSSRKTGE